MDRRQAQDVRVIEQMTRWTLTVLQNVERGLMPMRMLQRTVDPCVLAALGPVAPPKPGAAAPVHVGSVRIHLVNSGLAHVASTAVRPNGHTAGYVLELRSDHNRREWRVTELTTVQDRKLVPPGARLAAFKSLEEEPRRYPADITGLIGATERARADAQRALVQAQNKADGLKQQMAERQGKGPRKVRERAALAEKERAARAEATRWERATSKIDEELRTLHEVRELREVRQLVIDGDPLMKARKPEYLDRLLGPVPSDRGQRSEWRQVASTVERYRQRWSVTDREEALGRAREGMPPEQLHQRQNAAEAAARYASRRELETPAAPLHGEAIELTL